MTHAVFEQIMACPPGTIGTVTSEKRELVWLRSPEGAGRRDGLHVSGSPMSSDPGHLLRSLDERVCVGAIDQDVDEHPRLWVVNPDGTMPLFDRETVLPAATRTEREISRCIAMACPPGCEDHGWIERRRELLGPVAERLGKAVTGTVLMFGDISRGAFCGAVDACVLLLTSHGAWGISTFQSIYRGDDGSLVGRVGGMMSCDIPESAEVRLSVLANASAAEPPSA